MARYIDEDEQKRHLECVKMLVEGFEKGMQSEPNTELTEIVHKRIDELLKVIPLLCADVLQDPKKNCTESEKVE